MKDLLEKGGILAQIPALLAVLVLFPIFGTDVNDVPVKVDASFYIWQFSLCILVLIEHFIFMKNEAELHTSGAGRNFIFVFYALSFVLTVLNLMRY